MRIHIGLLMGIGLSLVVGCGQKNDSGGSSQASFSFSEEPEFCSSIQNFSNPITLSSRAQFLARQVTVNGLAGPGPAQDIKFAEIDVLNSQGDRVQCGTTDATGNISLQLPNLDGTYKLRVLSRADSSVYKVSVLNSPYDNLPYALESVFSISGTAGENISLPTMIASHEGDVLGGAFNIMDQAYNTNAFLRANSTCSSRGDVCPPFTVAPNIRVFWKAGLSPYSYYGHPTSPLSFFSKRDDPSVGVRRGLYIQGGLQGDFNCSDTDHFDNSVIIHEYGHFIEDVFAKSDSPGGSHNGNFIIDPRLAWSEGWSNFFQTAVLGTTQYRDTVGNISCAGGTYLAVNLNMEFAQPGQDRMLAGTTAGEGIFREVSVSRVLYHTMSSTASTGGADVGFPFIWKVLSDAQSGFRNLNYHFRNIGLFNQLMRDLITSHDSSKLGAFDTVVASEYQLSNQSEYALPIFSQINGSCTFSLQGIADSSSLGKSYSNLLRSNDFFSYYYDGSNPAIELHYSGNVPTDLDLDIYRENYVYNEPATIVARSHHSYPESGGGYEAVNLSGLPAGVYLINVRANTSSLGNPANYYLSDSLGGRLCP